MGETKIEMKIDEEIKPLKELCEKIVKMATNEIEQNPSVDTHEMYEVVDMIKDLSEAKKFVAETCYKKYILGVMQKNEDDFMETWDEDGAWDEEGRRYYRGQSRDSMGRYTSRGGNRNGRSGRGGRMSYQEPPYYHIMPEDDYMMDMETYKNYSAKELRDLDRKNGRLYYTDMGMGNNQGSSQNNGQGMNQGRDSREGRSGMSRRSYMETKEMHSQNTTEDKQAKMKELDKYMNELGTDIKEMVMDSSQEEKTMLKTKMQNIINTL